MIVEFNEKIPDADVVKHLKLRASLAVSNMTGVLINL